MPWSPDQQADVQRIYGELWPGKCPRGRGWALFHEALGDLHPSYVVAWLEEHARAGDGFPPKLPVLAGQCRDTLRALERKRAREAQGDDEPGISFGEFVATTDWRWTSSPKISAVVTVEERWAFVEPRLGRWRRGVSLAATIGLREPGEED